MILQQYIQEVLFKQRICVVPQLGTFSVQHFPAHYNSHAQTLTAPREQVMFTQQWQDDGSCVEWIALKENLVPAVAQRKLEKYLEELKAELQSGKPLVLPGIGQLQGDFTGNIHFHAEELPVEKETLDLTPIERTTDSRTAPAFVPPPPEALEPIMTEEVEDTLEAVTEESGFKWWWAAIPIAAIVIGLAAWWYLSGISKAVSQSETPPDTEVNAKQLAAAAADSIQKALADSTAKAAITPITYYAVVERYKDSTIAVKKQKQQLAWGKTLVLYKRDSMYRTAVELHSLVADTTVQRDSIRKVFGNKVFLEF
ncbi:MULTISPECIES: HU domain-containing protein [Chitinophaga]|uniref:HU domain-containing protein n=1 Tax=Chitinophaga TaxID=79328 RepID=UPI000DBA3105|nr:hypothetical protein [Chitinophaga ginsengisegetis]MDR6569480.1 hypothetical protein [Chitinophaga ginsengisegetis]MDR6649213.1 hypothetical protein [Chitinophaga ginsengisegetis]MDR6655563.1 hypothetical protein [Chitinophaga ginsengisegetis]